MAGDEDKDRLIAKLKKELQEKENNIKLSAEIGKSLLVQNNDWEIKCEELSQEHSRRIEALEQEKHSLQMRLATTENMQKNQLSELESQREQLIKESEQDKEHEQVKHGRIVQQLQAKIDAQHADLEMAGITEEQLKQMVKKQEEMLKCAHDKLKSLEGVLPVDDNDELMSLRHGNNVLKSEKDFLQIELKETQDKLEQISFLLESKDHRTETLSKELDEERQQAISYFNALEICREELTDLQVQLDVVRMESSGHQNRGNSLFGEVEDRRKEMKSKMITMKVQMDTAKEQLAIKKQQIHKLKFQIAGLLQMGGGRADAAQLERLEQALSQRDGEIQLLNSKLAKLQQNQTSGFDQQLNEFCQTMMGQECGGLKVDTDLIDFIKTKLKDANEKNEKLSSELKTERLQGMIGKDNLMQAEKRLYASESEADRLRAANMKLSLKLDELRTKFNIPDPDALRQKVQKYYIEKIPLPTDKKDETAPSETAPSETSTAEAAEAHTESSQAQSSSAADNVFTYPSATNDASCGSAIAANPECMKDIQSSSHMSTIGKDRLAPIVPKLLRPAKKSVSMCETVSVLDETGQMEESANLKTGNEKSSVMKRNKPEDNPENEEPDQAGGKRKPRGRKCHNVVHMGSEPKNECKQQ